MAKINEKLLNLKNDNTFSEVIRRINNYKKMNSDKKIISLGIGDVTQPIIKPIIEAMHNAVDELININTFRGYGPSSGHTFLKKSILENEYNEFGITEDEIYISDGTKTDSTNILELFDINSKIYINNPMYPIYKDGSSCLNRRVTEVKVGEDTNFVPSVPEEKYDVIYICSPNNPIGIAYTYDDLSKWVSYALENNSVILFDNVYTSFITSEDVPKSIYEIPDARKVAIEFRSFSKVAGFSGIRCSYYIIPNEISKDINILWKERTINRFNGVNYIAQRGAEATYLEESRKYLKENIKYYLDNASILVNSFEKTGFKVWGGKDSPYIWVKINNNMTSWEFFDFMLEELGIIIIPGIIFGSNGNKYFRISALGKKEDILKAIERMEKYYEK